MSMGAIFARGSCRALRWMALFGVVFALGGAQTVVQAQQMRPTIEEAEFEGVKVYVETSEPVRVDAHLGTIFALTSPTATSVSHTVSTAANGSDTFEVTFAAGTDITVSSRIVYSEPPGESHQVVGVTSTENMADALESAITERDVAPMFSATTTVPSPELVLDTATAITAIVMPAATGGNGDLAYSVEGGLRWGLTFTDNNREIIGTTTEMTDGAVPLTYVVTDADGDRATMAFTVTIGDKPDQAAPPTVTSVGLTLSVSWDKPADNNFEIVFYQVRYQMGAGVWTTAPPVNAPSTSTTITVSDEGDYNVQVRAQNFAGAGVWSVSATVDVLKPVDELTIPALTTTAFTQKVDEAIATPIELPAATGGREPRTYTVEGLPSGLTFTEATTGGGGTIAGTPTELTDGAKSVTYKVTDGSDPMQSDTAALTFTVNDKPDTPAAPTVTATVNTSGSLDVTWVAPADNNSPITDYELQHREMGAITWMHTPNLGTSTRKTFTALTDGTVYEFQVRARNAIDWSDWSVMTTGTPMASAAVPAAPAEPMVTAASAESLDVTWVAPADNGSAIIDYGLQYKMTSSANWTIMTAAITRISTTLSGLPAGTSYDVQVRARNLNGMSGWSPIGTGSTDPAPAVPDLKGQVTAMKLTGGVTEKNIGGRTRVHVTEGATDVELEMTVQWTHAEITALYGGGTTAADAVVEVAVYGSDTSGGLPNWVSWIDAEQDVHFPNSRVGEEGNLVGRVSIEIPPKPRSNEFPYSEREVRSSTGVLSVLILEDDSEAENDAFYIRTSSSDDVDLFARSAVHWTTRMTVIEDNEEQTVTVTYGTPASKGPTSVYENRDTAFAITAFPPRMDLPLDVRLDMLDLSGVTVSAAKISLSTASVTLNADRSGTPDSNEAFVAVHLPPSDGDRADDEYDLRASVNVYSMASGGYEAVEAALHRVNVIDIHKLPWLSVSPLAATVMEGNEIELTLTVNRNPKNTIATNFETRQYTSEALSITVMPTPSGGNYTVPTTVAVPAHNKRAPWTQEVMVTFEAGEDEDVDPDMALTLDFEVNGTVAANGPRPDGDTYSVAQAVLTIQDATTTLVSVRDNAYDVIQAALGEPPMVGVGMSGELMGANLFDYDATAVSVVYATSVEGGAVTASVNGGAVTVMGVSAGEAKVTITATATPNASSLVVNQTKSNVAQLTFPVMVEDEALTFMVSEPDDMNLAEGMSAMVTVMTNRPVTENTEVMLMRDGSNSATDADYELDPALITIMAGDMSGSTMVMAVEDDMAEEMEMLTLFLVVDEMQMTDQSVSFYIWDAAVPALPLIAQLLLAALLGLGGYRRYLRRR